MILLDPFMILITISVMGTTVCLVDAFIKDMAEIKRNRIAEMEDKIRKDVISEFPTMPEGARSSIIESRLKILINGNKRPNLVQAEIKTRKPLYERESGSYITKGCYDSVMETKEGKE